MTIFLRIRNLLALLMLCMLAITPASALEFLDNMIYSAKCAASEDVDACKAKARQDFEKLQDWQRGKCFTINESETINIDAAYAEIIDRFGFRTLEEAKNDRAKQQPKNFKHRVVPGNLYDMCDSIEFRPPDGMRFGLFACAKLKKEKTDTTSLEATYCLRGDALQYSNLIGDAFKNTIK